MLERINSKENNRSTLVSQAKNGQSYTRKNNRMRDYEGYSQKKKDQVELILSTLNTNIRSKKDVRE